MAQAAPARAATPASLETLIERYDPDVIDVPGGKARVRLALRDADEWDVVIERRRARLEPATGSAPDALLTADRAAWNAIARDVRGGMVAFQKGKLTVRHNLHLGVGLLAATSGMDEPGRLRFHSLRTKSGSVSVLEAGTGEPVVALHGLGGTKASFLPTVAALAPEGYRVIAADLPGFGESDKPIGAPYDAAWFARRTVDLLDALKLDQAHVVGNSMGGRIALETGLTAPERVGAIALLCPAVAWLRERPWARFLRLVRPELGLLQPTPRPVVEGIVRRIIPGATDDWAAAGVDEFLRSYLTPRGRAAFYAAARNIYLDEPGGENGFWPRLGGLERDSLFIWGRHDGLVPAAFRHHVEEALPAARHYVLDCGHVPQLEAPRETHGAMREFFAERPL
jgi:pimeloyl-ACP methyl ester carboxylesterase